MVVSTMGNSSAEQMVKVGDVVEGRYRVIKTLGEGGMGTVFLAEHTLIKRRVAIKVLHSELATDADVVERFMNEARAAGTLGHPNIVESTDMGFTHGHIPYIIFEYLEGTLLTDEIYRVGGLPVRRAVWIAQQIASALRAAHNAEIVHRDLKSDNIFLTDKDELLDHVKVLDFGISRFLDLDDDRSARGMVMGTPEFMAPEQITTPDKVDRRADIYALGVILYEMLEARRPFVAAGGGTDPLPLLERIVREQPAPLQREGIPYGLCEMILHKLLAKDPDDRFQSMAEAEAALEAFITQDNLRRRRTPLSMQAVNVDDVARHSDMIPRPFASRNTPWPESQQIPVSDTTLHPMSLPTPPAQKRSWALYGIAAVGLVVGAVGLTLALTGGHKNDTVATPAPPPTRPAPAPAAAMQPAAPSKIAVQIEADVPDARVTFRRRLAAAPTQLQVASSDIVELVEVSAPGYKTMRYWLTFDRPTHLNAHLVKGKGLVEASEEQTLVALGEVAPAAPEPAAAPAAAPTPKPATTVAAAAPVPTPAPVADRPVTTAKTVQVAAARVAEVPRRRIGKTATEPAVVASADPAPKEDKPEAKPDAEPLPSVTKPDADKPLLGPKPEAVPVPAIVKTPPKPSISQQTIASVVGKNRPAIIKCFADGKKMNPGLKGTLTVHFQVDPSGAVKRPQVQSTITGAPLVAACVARAAQSWKFPARSDGGMANVAYPFVIN